MIQVMQESLRSLLIGVIIGFMCFTFIKTAKIEKRVMNVEKRVERIDHEWTLFYTELSKGFSIQNAKGE